MHIAVNLGVQKVASFQVDNLLPEEIDHEINMAVRRFINQRYSPQSNPKRRGFEQSQKRIDDLRNLLEDFHVPARATSQQRALFVGSGSFFGTVYTSPSAGSIRLERFKLPLDYMYLINIKADVISTCNRPINFGVSTIENAFLRIKASAPEPGMVIRRISVATGESVATNIFESTGNSNNMEELLNPLNYAEGFVPSLSNNDSLSDMFAPSLIADSPIADSSEFYLKYPTKTSGVGTDGYPDEITEVNFLQDTADSSLDGLYAYVTYDYPFTDIDAPEPADPTTEPVPTRTYRYIFEAPTYSTQQFRTVREDIGSNQAAVNRTLCKHISHDDIFAVLDDPFNTAKSDNILYTIQENFVDLYSNNKTVPLGVTIKYLRRPASVNISAGVGCELAEHTHHEIVEMTVKSILEAFESPRYQSQSGEVLESE